MKSPMVSVMSLGESVSLKKKVVHRKRERERETKIQKCVMVEGGSGGPGQHQLIEY